MRKHHLAVILFLALFPILACGTSDVTGDNNGGGNGGNCVDNDGDGYGNPASVSCTNPQLDCNDNNPAIHPGLQETPPGDPICSDGQDNDCDGFIDTQDAGCVSSGDFTDNGNGTVTDNDTGLIWQQTDDGQPRSWSDAGTYCENLALAGLTGWFLPTVDQMKELVYPQYWPTIDPLFVDTQSSHYWTSTENQTCCAWSVYFMDGSRSNAFSRANLFYVRCAHQP